MVGGICHYYISNFSLKKKKKKLGVENVNGRLNNYNCACNKSLIMGVNGNCWHYLMAQVGFKPTSIRIFNLIILYFAILMIVNITTSVSNMLFSLKSN